MDKRISLGLLALLLGLLASPALAQPDTEPPALVDFDFNPKGVDVTTGAATVTCTMTVTDDIAGAQSAYCQFRSPSGIHAAECGVGTPSTGDGLNGVWTCDATVAQYVEEGTWTVDHVGLDTPPPS